MRGVQEQASEEDDDSPTHHRRSICLLSVWSRDEVARIDFETGHGRLKNLARHAETVFDLVLSFSIYFDKATISLFGARGGCFISRRITSARDESRTGTCRPVHCCIRMDRLSHAGRISCVARRRAHLGRPGRRDRTRSDRYEGSAVLEIRRRSGLTFDELADLFNVSRRAVHHWANGKVVSSANEQAIRQVLDAIRLLDRGDAAANRVRLLSAEAGAPSLFVRLKAGDFTAVPASGRGAPIEQVRLPLSRAAETARLPPAPALLLDGDASRPRIATRGRVARVVRARRDAG